MNDVIRATIKAHNKGGPGKIEWRVLVKTRRTKTNKQTNKHTNQITIKLIHQNKSTKHKEMRGRSLHLVDKLFSLNCAKKKKKSDQIHSLLGGGQPLHEDGLGLHQNARALCRGHHQYDHHDNDKHRHRRNVTSHHPFSLLGQFQLSSHITRQLSSLDNFYH